MLNKNKNIKIPFFAQPSHSEINTALFDKEAQKKFWNDCITCMMMSSHSSIHP